MRLQKTYAYISILLINLLLVPASYGKKKEEPIPQAPLFCGVAVQADLSGPVMKALNTKFNQFEVGARLNFRDHYFPMAELGIGEGEREGQENNNHFYARAPYARIGMDYNLRKKHNGNRLMVGARYAFSSFKYDFECPDFTDPVWGVQENLTLKDQKTRAQWLEFGVGCETKLWSFIRLGWSLRMKARLRQSGNEHGEPWYIPGYGKNGATTFGGTMNLIFDVGRTTKKTKSSKQHE